MKKVKIITVITLMIVGTIFSSTSVFAEENIAFKPGLTVQDLDWGLEIVPDDSEELVLISLMDFADVFGNSLTRSATVFLKEDPNLFLAQRAVLMDKEGNQVIQEYYLSAPVITANAITQTHKRTETFEFGSVGNKGTIWAEGLFTADSQQVTVTVSNPRGNVSIGGGVSVSNLTVKPNRVLSTPPYAEVTTSAKLTSVTGTSTSKSATIRVHVNGGSNAN